MDVMEIKMDLDKFIISVFIISLCVALLILILRKSTNGIMVNSDLKGVLIQIFVVQTSLTFTSQLQIPYRYQLFLEDGLSHADISQLMCYHHLVTAIWTIFLPFIMKKIGHRWICALASIIITLSSILCGMCISRDALSLSMCLYGISLPSITNCIQDIWQREEKVMPNEWNANYVYNEVNSFVSLIVMWISSPLSSILVKKYGTASSFNFTPCLSIAAIIPSLLLIKSYGETNEENNEKPEKEVSDLEIIKEQFKANKLTFVVVLMDIITSVSIFMIQFRMAAFIMTESHKPPMGFMQGSLGVLELIGAQLISYMSQFLNYAVWLGISLAVLGFVIIQIFAVYENKTLVFINMCLYSIALSIYNANIFFVRKEYYPSNVRMYFLSMVNVPTSIITFMILTFYKTERIEFYALLSGALLICGSIICLIIVCIMAYNTTIDDEDNLLDDINEEKDESKDVKNRKEEIIVIDPDADKAVINQEDVNSTNNIEEDNEISVNHDLE